MIVKVQQSLFSSNGKKTILIYDKKRTVMYQREVEKDDPILEAMGDKPKKYFTARMVGTKIHIGRETWARDW